MKKIILSLLFIAVGCSTTPRGGSSSPSINGGNPGGGGGGGTGTVVFPETPFSDLPLPFEFYRNLLEGEVKDQVRNKALLSDARVYLSRGLNGGGEILAGLYLQIDPLEGSHVNDLVETLYIKLDNDLNPTSIVKNSVNTGRGSYRTATNPVFSTTLNNELTQLLSLEISRLVEMPRPENFYTDDRFTTTFPVPDDFKFYSVPTQNEMIHHRSLYPLLFPGSNNAWDIDVPSVAPDFILLKITDTSVEWIDLVRRRFAGAPSRYRLPTGTNPDNAIRIFDIRVQ